MLIILIILLKLGCLLYFCEGKALQGGNYWYFFCRRTQNRATASGYWDAEGDDEPVTSGSNDVGTKKTFAFYAGEAPGGIKTSWVMHEYHILQGVDSSSSSSSSSQRSSKKRGHPRMASIILLIF